MQLISDFRELSIMLSVLYMIFQNYYIIIMVIYICLYSFSLHGRALVPKGIRKLAPLEPKL